MSAPEFDNLLEMSVDIFVYTSPILRHLFIASGVIVIQMIKSVTQKCTTFKYIDMSVSKRRRWEGGGGGRGEEDNCPSPDFEISLTK